MKLASLFRRSRASESRKESPTSQDAINALALRTRKLQADGQLNIPLVGRGETPQRHAALYEFGRADLSLARIMEAHTDAVAILAEANCTPRDNALYGVWASDGPDGQLYLQETAEGQWVLQGTKRYCSGSTFLDAALVTAHRGIDLVLIDVPLNAPGISADASEWVAPAFQSTATGKVEFDHVPIDASSQIIGAPGWYLHRPGFWHGALGPAACWAGGASGLLDAAHKSARTNPHYSAHLGALEAATWGLRAILEQAGREIDADAEDSSKTARNRALSARHLIERLSTDMMDHFGRATGPALLAYDADIARRYSELTLYIRQCHGERDLEALRKEN